MGEAKRRRERAKARGSDVQAPRVERVMTPDTNEPMIVIRPTDPEMAVMLAKIALDKQDGELFGRLPSEVGNYTCVGFLAKRPDGSVIIVDEHGAQCGELQRGDSFVSYSALSDPSKVEIVKGPDHG